MMMIIIITIVIFVISIICYCSDYVIYCCVFTIHHILSICKVSAICEWLSIIQWHKVAPHHVLYRNEWCSPTAFSPATIKPTTSPSLSPSLSLSLSGTEREAYVSTVRREIGRGVSTLSDVTSPMASHWRSAYQTLCGGRAHINALFDFLPELRRSAHKQSRVTNSRHFANLPAAPTRSARGNGPRHTPHTREFLFLLLLFF